MTLTEAIRIAGTIMHDLRVSNVVAHNEITGTQMQEAYDVLADHHEFISQIENAIVVHNKKQPAPKDASKDHHQSNDDPFHMRDYWAA
jgi:hypothetical protein